MKPLTKTERAYVADRAMVLWLRYITGQPQEFLPVSILELPLPMERYNELWGLVNYLLETAGVSRRS